MNVTKEQWLAALRSGEYPQAKDAMYRNGGFCCLGVLCALGGVDKRDLDNLETNVVVIQDQDDLDDPDTYKLQRVMPEDLKEAAAKLGLGEHRPGAYPFRTQNYLASLNDKGESFASIADWIEENL